MPLAVLPAITWRKPLSCERVKINWEHPLNRGLVFWVLLNENTGKPIDLVSQQRPATMTPTWIGTQLGTAVDFTPNQRIDFWKLNFGTAYSAWGMSVQDSAADYGIICAGEEWAAWPFYLSHDTNKGYFSVHDGAHNYSANGPGLSGGVGKVINVVGARKDDSTLSVWVNGQKGTDSTSALVAPAAGGHTVRLGCSAYDIGRYLDGRIFTAAIWNRALSDAEAMELYKNPYGTPDNPRLI